MLQPADVTVYGPQGKLVGFSVIAANVNGDKTADGKDLDDLVIGAPTGSPFNQSGAVYVFFGRTRWQRTFDLDVQNADVTIVNSAGHGFLGWSVSSGNINGDRYADLVIGSPGPDVWPTFGGQVFVVRGGPNLPSTIDLAVMPPALMASAPDPNDQFGRTVASADVNGDGYEDVLAGAMEADGPAEDRDDAGEAYVFYGGPSIVTPRSSADADLRIFGPDDDDELGYQVAGGDFDGDGIGDMLIGAPEADGPGDSREDAGEAYVIKGSSSLPPVIDMRTYTPQMSVLGVNEGDEIGYTVSSGDMNGDGKDEALIGAWYADGPGDGYCPPIPDGPWGGNGMRCRAGETYVVAGSTLLPPLIDLATDAPDMLVLGADVGDESSYALSAGDFNEDGYDDLVIGARYADGIGDRTDCGVHPGESTSTGNACYAGEMYVVNGGSVLPSFVDLADPGATDLRVYGNGPRDLNLGQLGYTITLETGDLDGDGRDDLLMSAPYAAGPWWIRSYGGEVYVLFSRDTDADGVGDAADNCPNASNSNQLNTDASVSPPGDRLGDACDPDDDDDHVYDFDEPPCGGDPLNPAKRPERLDLPGDDDGDGEVNEPLPAGASMFDCDGDGFRGAAEEGVPLCANTRNDDNSDDSLVNDGCPALSAAETVCTGAMDNDGDTIVNDGCAASGAYHEGEFNARTSDQDPCGWDGWPADLWNIGGSTNDVDIFDLASFMGPVRRLDTSPGSYGYDHRWDVTPGPMVPGSRWINVQDLSAMSAVLAPPMLGKARAFDGPKCPWAP